MNWALALPRDVERSLIAARTPEAHLALLNTVALYIKKHAWRVMHAFALSMSDWDDLISEGRYGALYAASRFDLSYNVAFITYASPQIRHHMVHYARTQCRHGVTKYEMEPKEVDRALSLSGQTFLGPDEIAQSSELYTKGMSKLSERERLVVTCTLEGCALGEIADRMAIVEGKAPSSNRVRQLQIRARDKIVKAIGIRGEP